MATFLPIRDSLSGINNTPIVDGQLLMTTDLGVNNRLFLDNNNNRVELGGAYLTANKTLYVSPTGSDTTGNGTSINPYKTIAKCNSVTPKILNGYNYIINMASGTYTEEIYFSGFGGGRIFITLQGNITLGGSVTISDCDSSIQIQSLSGNTFTFTASNTLNVSGAMVFSNARYVDIATVNIIIDSTSGGIAVFGGSDCSFASSVTINNSTVAANVTKGAEICFGSVLTGSGNTIGIRTNNAIVAYDPAQFTLSATTLFDFVDGGIITNTIKETPTASNLGTVTTILTQRNINSCNFALYAVSGAWTAGSSYTICTLSTPYRPTTTFLKEIILRGEGGTIYYGGLSITTRGVVSITPRQNMTALLMRISEGYII